MKDPEETIRRMGQFVDNIEKGEYQLNFVLQQGYRMFLIDLLAESKRLVKACEKHLERFDRGS